MFTQTTRYSYIDPDFAYNDQEAADVKAHRDKYVNYIQQSRNARMSKKDTTQHFTLADSVNIGLKPANGLKPPKPHVAELDEDLRGTLITIDIL